MRATKRKPLQEQRGVERGQWVFETVGQQFRIIIFFGAAKMRLTLLIVVALAMPVAFAEDTLQRCLNTAMTQDAMTRCAEHDLNNADAELNRLYRELQLRYKDDPAFIKQLRAAQSAWLRCRDAQLAMRFPPHPRQPYYYGSVLPMCSMLEVRQLTDDRITTLKEWLAGSSEGDVRSGSMKSSEEMKPRKGVHPQGRIRH